jgi:hypothetical protein
MKTRLFLLSVLALGACSPSAPPEAPSPVAPPGPQPLAISETRPIEDLHRRTIGFLDAGVWISNEFDGGRVSDAWQEGNREFVLQIRPENAPVNNSAWYAFKVWSDKAETIDVRLTYEDGRHRYWPETRRSGEAWVTMDSSAVQIDALTNAATLRLEVGPDTLWVAGQEMMTSSFFDSWTAGLAEKPYVSRGVAGRSGRGRPIPLVEFGDRGATRHVMVMGRQHPPEATGTMALLAFVEELAGDSPLAQEFRENFRVHVIPLVNPDGVDLGHWRHNTGGVDLNRDWEAFNQPEPSAVRETFTDILERPGHELWFGVDFHSTQYDVFYTLDRSLETYPPGVTDRWLDYIGTHLPDYEVNDSPSGLRTPTARNWFYRAFGGPALIYEVGDRTDRDVIREVATTAARGTMEILLDELRRR